MSTRELNIHPHTLEWELNSIELDIPYENLSLSLFISFTQRIRLNLLPRGLWLEYKVKFRINKSSDQIKQVFMQQNDWEETTRQLWKLRFNTTNFTVL